MPVRTGADQVVGDFRGLTPRAQLDRVAAFGDEVVVHGERIGLLDGGDQHGRLVGVQPIIGDAPVGAATSLICSCWLSLPHPESPAITIAPNPPIAA